MPALWVISSQTHGSQLHPSSGLERFFALHVHSDNAGSHFKSSKTMYFLTTLLTICAAWPAGPAAVTGAMAAGATATAFRAFWEFGPPGHGKGVWDGLGALVKRAVRQDIIDGVARDLGCHL
jgi:hypothetical protein